MNSEDLIKVIKSAKLEILNESDFCELDNTRDLIRDLKFKIKGDKYFITWFKNTMTLETEQGLQVMFNKVTHSSTWPNRYKRNLQFYNGDGVCAVIGLELIKVTGE